MRHSLLVAVVALALGMPGAGAAQDPEDIEVIIPAGDRYVVVAADHNAVRFAGEIVACLTQTYPMPCVISDPQARAVVEFRRETNSREGLQREPTCDDGSTPQQGECADGSEPVPPDRTEGSIECNAPFGPTEEPYCWGYFPRPMPIPVPLP